MIKKFELMLLYQQINKSLSIPIWVVSLKYSKRRLKIQHEFAKHNITYEFIDAVNGNYLSKQDLQKYYSPFQTLFCSPHFLSGGEIGCYLSHVYCWEKIVNERLNKVLILEDDVSIGEDFFDVMNNIDKFPSDWDRINFITDVDQIDIRISVTDNSNVSVFSFWNNRTAAYLLSKKGASKLLKKSISY